MAALGLVVVGLCSMVGLTLLRGLVLQALWLWFVAETFALDPLTLVQAIGLSLIVSFLTYQYDARADDDKSAAETITVASVLLNGFAYLVGAIVHSFA